MSDIIIAFPNPGDSKVLRSILIKNGYSIVGVVASGAQAINLSDDIDYGIVICAYRLSDMQYMELSENINESCELLLICSPNKLNEPLSENINFLPMPFKVIELVKRVSEISDKLYYERKRKKKQDGELVSFQYELYDFDLQKFYEKPKTYKDAPLGKFEELEAIEDAVRYLNSDEEVTLLVPSVLAYGTYGDGDQIPYDMPLIIKLKLIK